MEADDNVLRVNESLIITYSFLLLKNDTGLGTLMDLARFCCQNSFLNIRVYHVNWHYGTEYIVNCALKIVSTTLGPLG